MKPQYAPVVSRFSSAIFAHAAFFFVLLMLLAAGIAAAQSQPNLENGFKHWGSYDFHNIDTVNTMNGNWMLNAPLLPAYPQRGSLSSQVLLYGSSKTWQVQCKPNTQVPTGLECWWTAVGLGVFTQRSMGLTVKRTINTTFGGTTTYQDFGYSLTTPDGSAHNLSNNVSFDTTGYQLQLSVPDTNGVPTTATVTDRHGNQYVAIFPQTGGGCMSIQRNELPPVRIGAEGSINALIDDAPMGDTYCPQSAVAQQVTDANGNRMMFTASSNPNPGVDTMGRNLPLEFGANPTTDYSGCVSRLAVTYATWASYTVPDGSTRQMKQCYAIYPVQTFFNAPNVSEAQASNNGPHTAMLLVTLVLADGTKWTFDYDGYGEVTSIGLPTGGSITYTWTTINFSCSSDTPMSRAIVSRTMNDNRGHSYTWNYSWGTPVNGVMANTVTDANGNDTVHTFTNLVGVCGFYETRTQEYQGSGGTRQLFKQVDTAFQSTAFDVYNDPFQYPGNVEPISIRTTLFPSGKVSLVTRQYDTPSATGAAIFGNVVQEKQYDWGLGAPGPLLRETDTTYQWQMDSRYLTAGLLDLPNSVIVKDGSGCTLSKTTYGYDETGYLQTYTGSLPAGTHFAPPYAVLGNQTSVNRYLWNLTSGSCAAAPATPSVVSHNAWYDTGELYQQIDPLGHTTTHSYHSSYAGAYSTQTCNALNQCVSGTYDFNTGVLNSFTDANAGYQASGVTPGDPAHTSNYIYDYLFRLTSAQAPPDPGNGNARPQTSFTFSAPGAFPLSVQEQKSITSTLTDVSTAYFDGLARPYQTQHATPSGTATVDTSYDGLFQVTSVTNPYYNNTDPTFGTVQTVYDALGRVTQTIRQDNSASSADYTAGDNCVISSDEAGKQRRSCSDALGRLISVDEPGDSTSTASPVTAPGTHASATVTISGADQSATGQSSGGTSGTVRCPPRVICDDSGGGGGGTTTIYDFGTVSITVNQRVYTASFSSPQDLPATIAAALAAAINADQSLGVTATSSAGTVSLTSISASSAGSFTLTTSYTWDSTHFTQPSFTSSVTGIQGGTDGQVFGGHAYTTLYTYDALGNLLQVTQQGGTTTQSLWRVRNFSYDSLGRLLTSSNPESGTITYQYDNDGNLLSKTDARGLVTTYAYDPLHRLTGKSYSDNSPALIYVYDHLSWYANSNPVGRLVEIYNSANHAAVYDYDVMGRLVLQQESDGAGTSLGNTSAAYDLAGNMTSLTYPSGRKVTFNYNSANQLDQVQFTQWAGASITPYTYWSASDANFSPMGSPNAWTLGNGVVESAVFNKRLQLQQETVTNSAIHTLMDHAFNYGAPGANNGNVMSVADQLNPARSQSFTYDGLNRLLTANESRWGLGFGYDPWGNRLQQNVTSGSAGTSQLNVDNRNRIVGASANCTAAIPYCYDAAGDLLNDGFHQYTYDAESRIAQVDGGAAVYSYDANGQRVRKTTASGSTQYLYFGGSIIAEKNLSTGDWTDYVFANGKRIAQAFSNENRIRVYGSSTCTSCSGQWAYFAFPTTAGGLTNYVIKTGDRLFLRQTEIGTTQVGIGMNFTDGTDTWGLTDQDGQAPASDGLGLNGAWHSRSIDLSARQGKTISMVYLYVTPTGSGNWSGYFNDIAIVSSDGSVYPLFSQNDTATFSRMDHSSGISAINYELNRDSTATTYPFSVHYYHGDQIGSSRLMTSAQGWPIWQGTFLPFGEEYNPQISSNHYKFTGKERDAESGLDYFGARYYGSGLGRFITPDWAAKPMAIPYASLDDPQSLNRYSYVHNRPVSSADPDGHKENDNNCYLLCWLESWFSRRNPEKTDDGANARNPVIQRDQFVEYSAKQIGDGMKVVGTGAAILDPTGIVAFAEAYTSGDKAAISIAAAALVIPTVAKIRAGSHAAAAMAEHNVSAAMVRKTMQLGTRFYDQLNDSIVYVLEKKMASGKDLAVAVDRATGELKTVFVNKKAVRPRFIPLPK